MCAVPKCDSNSCSGRQCSKCTGEYLLCHISIWKGCTPHCLLCIDDYYLECPRACDACCTNLQCWGPRDRHDCSSCPDNYYLGVNKYCYPCNKTGCICSADNQCIDCLPGKYNGTRGFCSHDCPDNCIKCTSDTACTECIAGKYGKVCELDCIAPCKSGTCQIDSGRCISCSENCVECTTSTSCDRCSDEYYLGDGGHCVACSNNCKNKTCEQTNGFCAQGCVDGFWGERCNRSCSTGSSYYG